MAVDRSKTIQNAQRFTARGQLDKAIEEWKKLVSQSPQDGNIFNTIGDLYLKKNDTHHAIETFMQAATSFERAGFALKTIAVYKKILKIDPSNLEVNLKLADLNAERGLTGNAIEDYLKVAKEYGRKGKIHEALDIYRKIANVDPNNTNIRLKLAELSLREKLKEDAINEFMNVAELYEKSGRTTDAAEIYKKVLGVDPTQEKAKAALKGTVTPAAPSLPTVAEIEEAMEQQEWDLAAEKVGVLVLHEPSNVEYRRLRGRILLHQEKTDLAWADYRAVVDEVERAGDAERAVDLLKEVLGIAPQCVDAAELYAKMLDKQSRVNEAIEAYASLIAVIASDEGGVEHAREFYERMKELDSSSEQVASLRQRFGEGEVIEDAPVVDEPVPPPQPDAMMELPVEAPRAAPVSEQPEPVAIDSMAAQLARDIENVVEQPDPSQPGVSPVQPVQQEPREVVDQPSTAPSTEPQVPQEVVEESLAPTLGEISESMLSDESLSRLTESLTDVTHSGPAVDSVTAPLPKQSRPEKSVSHSRPSISSRHTKRPATPSSPKAPSRSKRIRAKDLPDYFAEAEVYLKYGLAGKAIEQYQLIISADAKNIEAHAKLRELLQLEGRVEEAVTHSITLAHLYQARGQEDDAEQVWAEAREWSPDDSRLQADLDEMEAPAGEASIATEGTTHEQTYMPEVSVSQAFDFTAEETTINQPKQDLQEWLAEAEFYLQQGLNEQAHQLFETIRQHYPDAPEVLAYFEPHQAAEPHPSSNGRSGPPAGDPLGNRRLDELAEVLNQSSVTGSELDDASLSSELAEIFPGAFRGDDQPPPTKERLNASVEGIIRGVEQGSQPLPPGGPDPHFSLGLAYKEMGLYAEARKEFEQALALPDYHVDSTMMIAFCYKAEGQPQEGLTRLQNCLESLPQGDEAWIKVAFEMGVLSAEAGLMEEAMSQLQQVLSHAPDHEPAATLLKELEAKPKPHAVEERHPEALNVYEEPVAARSHSSKPEPSKRRRISYV